MVDLSPVYSEIIILLFAVGLPAVYYLTKSEKALSIVSLVGIIAAMIPLLIFYIDGSQPVVFAGGLLRLDAFAVAFKLVFLAVALYVTIASIRYVKGERHLAEYYSLILLATLGMMVVASSLDLITLFVGLELASLSSYALVGFRKADKRGIEAATKYLIIGALSSAISLYGISLIYGITGSTVFADIGTAIATASGMDPIILLAIGLLIAGFGFKVAIVPFHMWAPDVYEGAPTTITSLLASSSKKMGFVALFKIFLIGLIAIKADWDVVVAVIAVLTMTIGNLVAISQTNIKRMLAYSSIAQAGYILIVLPIGTEYALAGGIFHIITHAFMKGGAFIIVAALSTVALGESLADYKGLGKRSPFLAFSMGVLLLSLAGIPPLSGFASKFWLFSSAVDAAIAPEQSWVLWLAVFGVINSAISLYYYVRVIKYMYVESGPEEPIRVPNSMILAIAITVVATIVIGLFPSPILELCREAARAFFSGM
ncbi:MAG: NADH-quinone oxidoreductase subunit N [Methanomassiliicoccales archaeon]|nr:NADH-quinone oxidoreductase subunit N [Methanomassiliicoccales archaeon]